MTAKITKTTIFLLAIIMVSCTAAKNLEGIPTDNEGLPINIDPEPGYEGLSNPDLILLILKRTKGPGKKTINNVYQKSFRKKYKGKFEMVTQEEIDTNPKYKDTKTYQYILHDKGSRVHGTTTYNGATKGFSNDSFTSYDFYLFDRTTNRDTNIDIVAMSPRSAGPRAVKKLNKYLPKK